VLDWLTWLLLTGLSFFSAAHALLNKRDPRAAVGWIVVCLAMPGVGVVLYWLLGVNRIRSRARDWQQEGPGRFWSEANTCAWASHTFESGPFRKENFASLRSLSDTVTRRPLLQGNRVEPLYNGEQAYPAMLEAIYEARQTVYLSSYIFETNQTGRDFVAALNEAAERGVDVRVLVDALGEYYSFPPVRRLFRNSQVRFARFLPPSLTNRGIHLHLRNHRKLLVVDSTLGFTGGMNIGDRHLADTNQSRRVVDIHFRVTGPVVGQMQEAFLEDWQFVTDEPFESIRFPTAVAEGQGFCRGISAGPNEDFEKLSWILVGALNCARERVRIMTPYFIPDRPVIASINAAVLRGVEVEIILPAKNNLPFVAWAAQAYLWEFLQYGTRIYYQPAPFVHSKFLMVDDYYVLLGSANFDPRSLRLNFEFNLEVYDHVLTEALDEHFDAVRRHSKLVTLHDMDSRSLTVKMRDSLAKLFSPYL